MWDRSKNVATAGAGNGALTRIGIHRFCRQSVAKTRNYYHRDKLQIRHPDLKGFNRALFARQPYNGDMARGWESKAVESQIEDFTSNSPSQRNNVPAPEAKQLQMKKSTLLLSRKHIVQELEGSNNERYSELLRRTLADLDAQIAE